MNTCHLCDVTFPGSILKHVAFRGHKRRLVEAQGRERLAAHVKRGVHTGTYPECRRCEIVSRATYNPNQPCRAACQNARESICICSCGGMNHGLEGLTQKGAAA